MFLLVSIICVFSLIRKKKKTASGRERAGDRRQPHGAGGHGLVFCLLSEDSKQCRQGWAISLELAGAPAGISLH